MDPVNSSQRLTNVQNTRGVQPSKQDGVDDQAMKACMVAFKSLLSRKPTSPQFVLAPAPKPPTN